MKYSILLAVMFWVNLAGAQAPALALADSLFDGGNYTRAINEYAKNPSLNTKLKIAYAYNSLGNFDKAILQYEAIVGEYPELLLVKKDLGNLYLKTKRYEKAAETFGLLLENDSLNPDNYYRLGLSFKDMGDSKAAYTNFKKTFDLDSTHVKNIQELGTYFLKKNQMDSVHYVVDKGLKVAPSNAPLVNLKALAYYNKYLYKKAIPYFEQLIDQNYIETYILMDLGKCYETDWRHKEAINSYKNAIAIDNGNAKAYYNIGDIFRKEKRLDSALVYFNKALTVKKVSLTREYVSLAGIYREKRDYNRALLYYKQAYKEDPDNYMIYYNICFVSDSYYKDPQTKLKNYENFIEKFGDHQLGKFYKEHALKRISELKAEIHLAVE